jgi:hypothetical protein
MWVVEYFFTLFTIIKQPYRCSAARAIEKLLTLASTEVVMILTTLLKVNGTDIRVTWDPTALSVVDRTALARALNALPHAAPYQALPEIVSQMVLTWDVETTDGEPYPLETGVLAELPTAFLLDVVKGLIVEWHRHLALRDVGTPQKRRRQNRRSQSSARGVAPLVWRDGTSADGEKAPPSPFRNASDA